MSGGVKKCKRLELWHNGERKREESAWSWRCSCGAEESGSTKAIALEEWRSHKRWNDVLMAKAKAEGGAS